MTKDKPARDVASNGRPASGKSRSVKSTAAAALSQGSGKASKKTAAQLTTDAASLVLSLAQAGVAAPVAAVEKKGHSLQFRARPALRAQIDKAAEEAGRSLSEEIEYRLTKSFEGRDDRATELLFGSRQNVRILTMFASALGLISDFEKHVEEDPNAEWSHSVFGQAAAAATLNALIMQWVAPEPGEIQDEEQAAANDLCKLVLDRLYLEDQQRRLKKRAERRERGIPDYAKALGLYSEDE